MSSIPVFELPTSLHRLAAQLLEEMRANERIPGWEGVRLGMMARPLFRPDIRGIAYYEFPVVTGLQGSEPAGFIVVSTGDHDFPVAQWSSEGISPCEKLQRRAEANGRAATRFYKLDTLAYVAEDEMGEMVAASDARLGRVSGLDPGWLDAGAFLHTADWVPFSQMDDDIHGAEVDGVLEVTGPDAIPGVEFTGWETWQELKASYATTYALLLESLRRQASADWEINHLAQEFGEGLVAGETYRLACLDEAIDYQLLGPGSDFVEVDLVRRDEVPPVLEIKVRESRHDEEFPFDVVMEYPNRSLREEIRFVVVAPPVPTGLRLIKLNPGTSAWSGWQEYWAGSHHDQRMYDQIPPRTSPNPHHCYSGCGNTAWAMLFGWADFKAAQGNARWRNRTGLYLKDGGKGADAVAPVTRDRGVTNMIWEIRDFTWTQCDPFSRNGFTLPGLMSLAAGYFKGRTGAKLHTRCSHVGIHWDFLRDAAVDVIRNNGDPVVIGTGFLSHYPLAYGYHQRWRRVRREALYGTWMETQYQREFLVNQGDGRTKNWVPGSTWFAGWITP